MKFPQQQPKSILPLFKRASLLLLFSLALTGNAQSFYFVKGTQITLDETTTFFVTDSGKVSQARLKNFEEEITENKQASNQTKQTVFNRKKFSSKKDDKKTASKSSEKKSENVQKIKTESIGLKPCPDHFISSYQQGMAVSASVPGIKYNSRFFIEHTTLKTLQGYSASTDHETVNNSFLFLNDYHWLQYVTRPPPFEFYSKNIF